MKYAVDLYKLRDKISQKINTYFEKEKAEFNKLNEEALKAIKSIDLTDDEASTANAILEGTLSPESVEDKNILQKVEQIKESVMKMESDIQEGKYNMHLFTIEEIMNDLSLTEQDVLDITYGQEERL